MVRRHRRNRNNHDFRSRQRSGGAGWYVYCTCGWVPEPRLVPSVEEGERIWLDEHMRPEHDPQVSLISDDPADYQYMVSCKCGWVGADYLTSWEASMAMWENTHYAAIKAERSRLEAEQRVAEQRAEDEEKAEIRRRVEKLKQKYSKKS